jgi:hypothetical protein
VSRHPADREQNWYPLREAGRFTGHVREGIEVTAHQLELLQPAREQLWLLDDATVARIIGAHRDQADDLALFQNQADRWKSGAAAWRLPFRAANVVGRWGPGAGW